MLSFKAHLIAAGLLLASAAACADETPTRQMRLDDVDLRIELADSGFRGGTEPLLEWIQRSLGIVRAYYGTFPTSSLRIRIVAEDGGGVHGGKTWGNRGGFIRVQVGRDVTPAQLLDDWVLVHEMTHLALPDVGDDQSWFSEGLAVYVEGVARAQAGNRTQQDVFAEQMKQMPRGMPQAGDRGLDHTHTWARTYWGGAMFCFLADVEIHRRTGNRSGLQDAMRAVAKASGGLSADWSINQVFATADAATGTKVLEELYAQMKNSPVTPDLRELWAKLGVEPNGGTVRLRDDAPLADVRRAIMEPRVNKT
ncbi:MAG: hypothetical protein ACJ8R9_28195 [Steroidobacteraceae bacterium]